MFLMGDKMFKYMVKFSLRFTECFYEIICLYYLDSVFHRIKDLLWGLWCYYTPQSIGRPPKLWGFVRGVEIRSKRPISSRSKDIGSQMSLMGVKMFKYIVKFSVRFTECFYEIICLYQFDSFFHMFKDILWGLWCSRTRQPIGRPWQLWRFVRRVKIR